jgi:hypothetical protein
MFLKIISNTIAMKEATGKSDSANEVEFCVCFGAIEWSTTKDPFSKM